MADGEDDLVKVRNSYTRDGSGDNKITSTAVGAKRGLDVNAIAAPAAPLPVQEQGQITSDEITITLTNFTGAAANILDKNSATEIVVTDPTAVAQIRMDPNQPIDISKVSVSPGGSGGLATTVTITIVDIEGNSSVVFRRDGAGLSPEGVDTHSRSPLLARRIDIDFGAPGLGNNYDVNQVVIYKTKGRQPSPNFPTPVQTEQQITLDDIESITLGGGGVWTQDPNNVLDKNSNTLISYDGAAYPATMAIRFTHPQRVSKLSAISLGNPMQGTVIDILLLDGTGQSLHSAAVGVGEASIDEDGFAPVMAIGVDFSFDSGVAVAMDVSEVTIMKVIDTIAEHNRNADDAVPLLTGVSVANGTPMAGDPSAPAVGINIAAGPNPAMAGSGTLIRKNENLAIDAEVVIDAAGGIAAIDVTIDWYYSFDNATFFYFASTNIIDTTAAILGNPNPTGFSAAGGLSRKQISQPLTAFDAYIAMAVRNNDAVNAVDASLNLVKQR